MTSSPAIDILEKSLNDVAQKMIVMIIFVFIISVLIHLIKKKLESIIKNWLLNRNQKKQHDQWTGDWVTDANARQNNRYEYMDPEKPTKYTYNERARMWVDEEQLEQERHRKAYEENRKRWQEYEEEEIRREREREEARREEQRIQAIMDQRKHIVLTPEEQELAKQIRIERKGPTFEEWKAEKLRQQQENNEHPEK